MSMEMTAFSLGTVPSEPSILFYRTAIGTLQNGTIVVTYMAYSD